MHARCFSAQTILEYSIVLGIVVVAMTAMQLYFKRGIQSAIKVAADQIGTQEDSELASTTGGMQLNESVSQYTDSLSYGIEREEEGIGGTKKRVFNKVSTSKGNVISITEKEDK